MIALTRPVSPLLAECELTHLERAVIDVARAVAQHAAYESLLRSIGVEVIQVAAAPSLPDSVFIEDTAIVLDELAVITRPGASSRRAELADVEACLKSYRRIVRLEAPATLDGGDVLRIGRAIYVGRSSRTNDEGIAQLRAFVAPHGYEVRGVDFHGCLHLKSAATVVGESLLLANPAWVSAAQFTGCDVIEAHPSEPFGANALHIGNRLVFSRDYPRTAERLSGRGLDVCTVDLRELAKAEGAVTCCCLLVE